MVSILQQECPILVYELHVLIFEDCTVLIAENRQQDFVFEFALDRMPLDVERRGVPGAGAVFQYIAPPPVQRLADAHVIGHDVEDEAQPVSLHRPDKFLEVLLASQLGIHHHGIDHVVPVIASWHRFTDRREVTIGDAEGVEIGHSLRGVGKGEPTMQLQPVGGQWKRRLRRNGHDARLNSSAFTEEGCGSTTRPEGER